MIRAHVFRQRREVTDIEIDTLSEVRTEKGTLVWVDIVSATEQELAQMREEFVIHELAMEDLSHSHQRPKLEDYPDQVLLVAYGAKVDDSTGQVRLHEVDVIAGALDVNLSMSSNRVNEVAKTLTAYASIFAAITLVTGVYGMNFQHMPELPWRFGYAYAIGLMIAAAGGLWVSANLSSASRSF